MIDNLLEMYSPKEPPGDLPETALKIRWTGTAGFIIEYKGTTLVIDPFVTRPGGFRILFLRMPVNGSLCRETFPKADYIVVGHSHYDHLQDVPAVAEHTGAPVFGSESTAAVLRASGIDESMIYVIDTWKQYNMGSLKVTFIPSIHGLILFGRVPFDGEIQENPRLPMRASHYKTGGTYGILVEADRFRFAHFGSANMIDEELERLGKVDMLMLGISGRQKTENFLERMTRHTRPGYILIHHYDNFFKPLKGGRQVFRGVHLGDFIEEYEAVCANVSLLTPDFFQPVVFDTRSRTVF